MKMRTATRAKRSTSGTQVPFGAIGLGALAVGAVAFGALVIRALAVKRGKIGRRDIEDGGVRMKRDVREGMLKRELPYLSFGHGPPLIVFPGLGMTNANPAGFQRWGEVRLLAPLARAFTVYRVGRRVGMEPGTTMTDLANDYAKALEDEFGGQLDVLGISTGGSLALQLAADRPGLVRKLVVAGAAYRLSEHGREFQRTMAELAAAGDRRRISQAQAPDVADSRLGRRIAGGLLWLAGPLFIKRDWDPSDMIATIMAEDAFDIGERLGEISAPTLVIGGGRDRFYPPELFKETAERIPNARLVLYKNRAHGGTFADRRFARDVNAFFTE
ncbi:MAG: alpha/beta hydrolase [Actinomycetota bacterium]|nr:alpha/beta hydrolase [Actinomycetota bacterium]